MKVVLLQKGAAAFLLIASTAQATPSESERYADWAQVKATSLLRTAGLDSAAQPVSVRANVSFAGRITSLRVLHSSGSRDIDAAVEDVLKKVIWMNPPAGLADGAVTLNTGNGAIVKAEAR